MSDFFKNISQIEDELRTPSPKVVNRILQDTKSAPLDAGPHAEITIHATIRDRNEVGVVEVVKLTAKDLYGEDTPPLIAFRNCVSEIIGALNALVITNEDDIEFELRSIEFWARVRKLQRNIGLSPQHDELIATLLQVLMSETQQPMTQFKVRTLLNGFQILSEKVRFSDRALDGFYKILEDGGFDLDFAMSFMSAVGNDE